MRPGARQAPRATYNGPEPSTGLPMRTIATVTTSRADYGHLYWPMRQISAHPDLDLRLIVTGAHLSAVFGNTVQEITADGFEVHASVDCLGADDSDLTMAHTIARATAGIADVLAQLRPDFLLLIADRHEMLAPAAAALALRIPIAHIEGGDISEGAIDDAVRNALTKMSHLHFTPTEDARRRVLAMGEEAWRVTRTGAPSLDHLLRSSLPTRETLEARLAMALDPPPLVVAQHPVTLAADTTAEATALLEALADWQEPIVFCFPNADTGYATLIERATAFCSGRDNASLYANLDHLSYWALLHHARVLVGNSSSGIMETASVPLPTVDVGFRQQGRTRAGNVLHAAATPAAISAALEAASNAAFRSSLATLDNPYGDGHASERITSALAAAPNRETLLHKRALPLHKTAEAFLQ